MLTRAYRTEDRAKALDLLADARAIDSPNHRLQVIEELDSGGKPSGQLSGIALWLRPDAGDEAYLGPVVVDDDVVGAAERWERFYRLVLACARDAAEQGFAQAYFTVLDARLLDRLHRDYEIDPEPSGWSPDSGKTVQWDVRVELADAIAQLERLLDG